MPAPERQPQYYVTAPLLWPLLLGLRALGLDVDSLAGQVGLSTERLRDPDTRVPARRGLLLLQAAVEASGDPNLGLRLSLLYEPGAFGVLDNLARSARTLREAIDVLCRYERIHQNAVATSLRFEGDLAIIDHRMLHPHPLPRAISENTLANLVVIGRRWTGVDFTPCEVRIAHEAPREVELHSRLFRCPIRWNAPSDALVLQATLIDLPLLMSNAGLTQVLDRYANELLEKLATPQNLSNRVRACICAMLPRGDASLEQIARELGMGPRTLQRRLREENTSHEALLDQLRRQLGEEYLRQDHMSIEDVGLMLGFSDSRAFRRAFKRWTGRTPSQVRSDLHGSKAPTDKSGPARRA